MSNNIGDTLILCDADSIYFRVACVVKKKNEIRKGINHTMNEIKRNCMSDKLLVAVKGRGNFRNDIYPKYKANRKELEPDLKEALAYGHQYMVDYHGAICADGMEADDLVSIWAHECRASDRDYTVVGIDKDLLQIPGTHYNFVKKEIQEVDEDLANLKLMLQCLTGDNADNIPGIKGIGPKKAERILTGVPMERRWSRVRAAWRMHGAGSPILSRRLLTMLTTQEELDDIRNEVTSKTSQRKRDDGEEQNVQNSSVQVLPDGDHG